MENREEGPSAYDNAIAEWRHTRIEAFKRIDEEYHQRRRRMRERLTWLKANPSPMSPAEQAENLRRALFED